ncbi:MAG: hypothetical protein FGM24_06275 [Candidatus Kapabacteria bacterium]|nr:hypothetical protein [Candidatus Kapabacteria bacterium]
MRRLTTHMLLVVSLLLSVTPRLDTHELGDVATLIRHYGEHRQTQQMTLIEFLVEHYSVHSTQDSQADASHADHDRLPLKSHDHAGGTSVEAPAPTFLPCPLSATLMTGRIHGTIDVRTVPGPLHFQPPRP